MKTRKDFDSKAVSQAIEEAKAEFCTKYADMLKDAKKNKDANTKSRYADWVNYKTTFRCNIHLVTEGDREGKIEKEVLCLPSSTYRQNFLDYVNGGQCITLELLDSVDYEDGPVFNS